MLLENSVKEVVSALVNKARCQKFGVLCRFFFSACKGDQCLVLLLL